MVRISSVLNALTLSIAVVGYLPLAPYLDFSARWFFPAALAGALLLYARGRSLPPWLLTSGSIVLFLYFALGFNMDRLIVVTADLLVVFLGIRLLGERSGRNYLQAFALSLFCLAASSLFELSALFLVYLLALLLLLAVSLVVLTFHAHDPKLALSRFELKKVLAVSVLMPAAALPVLLFLFVLLPRTQYPLWDFLNRAAPGTTGFSDKVNPGGSASVSEVKSVVLRAVCAKLPESSLYWRGIVLNGFSGNAWVRLPAPPEVSLKPNRGEPVHQEIYPEPSRNPYLIALNVPRALGGLRYIEAQDAVFTGQRQMDKRLKYQVDSRLADGIAVKGGIDRRFYLALPERVSPRLRAEGRALAQAGPEVAEKLRRLEAFFRARRLSYATVGLPTGADPIDAFLFDSRRGNCEFFASACATLLRLAGVPARLVGGYRGGVYSGVGGYYLVTEDMAHVWVEAFVDGRGWVTVEPSAWSAGFSRQPGGAVRLLRMYADALGFFWNKAVITYDLEKQLALVRSAGNRARNVRLPAGWWQPVLRWGAALLLLPLGWALYRRSRRSPEQRLLARLRRVLRRRYRLEGVEQMGLYELAKRVDDPNLREFVAIYGGALYRDRKLERGELTRLKELVACLRNSPTAGGKGHLVPPPLEGGG